MKNDPDMVEVVMCIVVAAMLALGMVLLGMGVLS